MRMYHISPVLLAMAIGCSSEDRSLGDDSGPQGSDRPSNTDAGPETDTGAVSDSDAGGDSDTDDEAVGPGSYALLPPSQCHNQDYIDYQEGCREGDASSTCGGKCNTINACLESSAEKPHADITFICPRFMLFSDEMVQAAIDDGNSAFNYAVVGHDVDRGGIDPSVDRGGIDPSAESTCCQCYQLVFAYPSPNNDRQALEDPNDPNPPVSAIPIPKPLIVQSFNTGATPYTFDVYMAAGGFGGNNACAPGQMPEARSGQYLYTAYPTDGQPSQGGVKPASLYQECKTTINWVTTESLSSEACQNRVSDACSQIESDIPGLTAQSRYSCIKANRPESFYHLNWSVYAMKVECPEHLTQVTGCRLAPQGLPNANRTVTTAAQAAVHPSFFDRSTKGDMYETTTMEDCCRPSCASMDWISGRGLTTEGKYNAFYSCDANGVPITEQPPEGRR
jgi:hypothetical protein